MPMLAPADAAPRESANPAVGLSSVPNARAMIAPGCGVSDGGWANPPPATKNRSARSTAVSMRVSPATRVTVKPAASSSPTTSSLTAAVPPTTTTCWAVRRCSSARTRSSRASVGVTRNGRPVAPAASRSAKSSSRPSRTVSCGPSSSDVQAIAAATLLSSVAVTVVNSAVGGTWGSGASAPSSYTVRKPR